mgnify:CR=1 FL=1
MSTATEQAPTSAGGNRWLILAGGVLVQLAIGAVYAWSTFSKAIQADPSALELSKVQATIPFEVAIGMIFVGTFLGGRIQDKQGPRLVALVGVTIYSIGIILASFARDASDLWLLVLGYGVLGGFGLGLAYIVPIAMLQKWFPDKRGLITGIAVGGFGFGAVITSPLAQRLIDSSDDFQQYPTKVFLYLGIAYLVMGLVGASVFKNPPAGYTVGGATAAAKGAAPASTAGKDFTQQEAMRTPQWYLLTLILTISVTAGISLISVAAGTATDVAGMSAAAAATYDVPVTSCARRTRRRSSTTCARPPWTRRRRSRAPSLRRTPSHAAALRSSGTRSPRAAITTSTPWAPSPVTRLFSRSALA